MDEFDGWQKQLNEGTDRAVALICAANLDHILRTLLLSHFGPLSEKEQDALFEDIGAPMGNLHSRVLMAHALGAITTQERERLHIIRRIRNAFAHSPRDISFSHELIASECRDLDEEPVDPVVFALLGPGESRKTFVRHTLLLMVILLRASTKALNSKSGPSIGNTLSGLNPVGLGHALGFGGPPLSRGTHPQLDQIGAQSLDYTPKTPAPRRRSSPAKPRSRKAPSKGK